MSGEEEITNGEATSVIPKPRGNWAQYMNYVCIVVWALILYLTEQSPYHIARCLIIHFTALEVGALLKGICTFTEEMRHVTSRYHGNYLKALNACLDLHRHGLLLLLCAVSYLLLLRNTELSKEIDLCLNLSLVSLCELLSITFGLKHPSAAEISEICEKNNLNVAHGLAWSYYVGYLKVILPGLKDSIQNFNRSNNILLKCEKTWKLHILIPLSCEVYDDLQKVDSRIKFINNLPELNVDQAGIKRRSYKNSVYGILDENRMINYCIVEYATPLRSLYAMSQDESAAFSRQDRLEQAKLFCRTLDEILQASKDCSGCYRLIVYEGSEESDKHFLSKTILQHIRQQHQEEYTMCEREEDFMHSQDPTSSELLISGSDQPLPLKSGVY
ncbi:stimulator of interferon genes protein [Hemicordylus capensis]|uniref:stimulator of interferon genes protein n=1 Tax=Hemicordylus capensis TaxID=884348 RepID=UPI002302275F|nr:stimulator of interferon genes protein [Hemicordylus capensis]